GDEAASVEPASARSRSRSARPKPTPRAPIWRKLRRETPSQNCCRDPCRVSIPSLLVGKDERAMVTADLSMAGGIRDRWDTLEPTQAYRGRRWHARRILESCPLWLSPLPWVGSGIIDQERLRQPSGIRIEETR